MTSPTPGQPGRGGQPSAFLSPSPWLFFLFPVCFTHLLVFLCSLCSSYSFTLALCELHGIQPTAFAWAYNKAEQGWLAVPLLLFCVKQHMQLIFCQPTVVAGGTLHAQCPGAKQVPLAINTSVCVSLHVLMPSPAWFTARC